MKLPPLADVHVRNTHRLIPSKVSAQGTVFSRLTTNDAELNDLMELDGVTNDRLIGEQGLLPGIGIHELVYGVAYAHIVNAAFTHAAPTGARFNSPDRGAWYAGLERRTSIAEVAFHKIEALKEINWPDEEISTSDDYLADFSAEMHDVRGDNPRFRKYLKPGPLPACYAEPQRLAETLLTQRSNGIIYPSVRQRGGTCIACFRPTLVYNVRQGAQLEFRLHAERKFQPGQVREKTANLSAREAGHS